MDVWQWVTLHLLAGEQVLLGLCSGAVLLVRRDGFGMMERLLFNGKGKAYHTLNIFSQVNNLSVLGY